MDVVLKCYKSAVMKFQNKAMHHHLINQPARDLILQSRTESRKSCLCTFRSSWLTWSKRVQIKQAGAKGCLIIQLVKISLLVYTQLTGICTFLSYSEVSRHFNRFTKSCMATVTFTRWHLWDTNPFVLLFRRVNLLSKPHLSLAQQALRKVLFSLGENTF